MDMDLHDKTTAGRIPTAKQTLLIRLTQKITPNPPTPPLLKGGEWGFHGSSLPADALAQAGAPSGHRTL
jgi:hypothetical protein